MFLTRSGALAGRNISTVRHSSGSSTAISLTIAKGKHRLVLTMSVVVAVSVRLIF